MSEVKKKVDNEPTITIILKDQNGEETEFRIKRTIKMGKVFKAFAQRKGVGWTSLRFIDSLRGGIPISEDDTPVSLGLEDEDIIDVVLAQVGMISTFTSSDTSVALIAYLMMTDEQRVTAPVPIQQLKEKQRAKRANNNEKFTYKQNPDILHPSQLKILSELLNFVWDKTSNIGNSDRNDMRLTLEIEVILSSLDAGLDDKYKSSSLNDKFKELFRQVPGAHTLRGHKIALRMTKGPTNSCINFHCDGGYASSTSQMPLNAVSEYDGGTICFFMKDHLHMVPRVPGSLVQHPPNVLHGVTSVTRGIRKSLFIVDESNGLGEGGVIDLTSNHVITFLEQRDREKRQREVVEQGGSLANKKRKTEDGGIDMKNPSVEAVPSASAAKSENLSRSAKEEEIAILQAKLKKAVEEVITSKDEEIASLKESLKNSKPIDVIDLTDTTSSKLPRTENTPKSALAIQHEQNQKMVKVKEEKIAAETALEDVREDLEDNQEDMGRQVLFTNFLQSKIDELAALAEAAGADRARVAEIKGRSYSS